MALRSRIFREVMRGYETEADATYPSTTLVVLPTDEYSVDARHNHVQCPNAYPVVVLDSLRL